ncbi:benzoylformate decarboxylase [Yersinia aleksiciae]|uniref:benzoylformate decarboxylase n=2 Tax=Yersinia aleksiciae TaxID=263819 RepID=UPI0005E2318A|nr:benzoylformate decarboxylase [Yersinia aleksiciae]MDA5498345.1 benzoylformate decarboxylase [Yersinia aleksiciae]NIK99169.1 benzoylformate decarboxylase [Yersinia aleksiciae]WQC72559.1 benzoylformate decarboxylase [Yersinia aleksiciae]CFQ45816.1 acetolactate synthase catalytic subunit [Yersinia aleksiciae]
MKTVRQVTYDILRRNNIRIIFGNPGSNELPFLQNFPDDFEYILGLQESIVVGIADGYSLASGNPTLVNLHSTVGTGNAMGALANARSSHSPLIVIAGQQHRAMMTVEPYLANIDATQLPHPLVKWSYEPSTAQEVPYTISRAIHTAMSEARGPVYVSVPYNDWAHEVEPQSTSLNTRKVLSRRVLDETSLEQIAQKINNARNPVMVLGADIDADDAYDEAVKLVEKIKCPVWAAPSISRCPFPNTHPCFRGLLPIGINSISVQLSSHDLIIVIGAPVFRYHHYETGNYLPAEAKLIQITCDGNEATRAPVGNAYIADIRPTVIQLIDKVKVRDGKLPDYRRTPHQVDLTSPMQPETVFDTLSRVAPNNSIFVNESTSTVAAMWERLSFNNQGSYYFAAAGGLGFAMPASIGIQMACPSRPVFVVIGDGSSNYSIQSLWTAARYSVPVIFIVMNNGTYAALHWFASALATDGIPSFDLPDINYTQIAEGYGVQAFSAVTPEELVGAINKAKSSGKPALIEVATWGPRQHA